MGWREAEGFVVGADFFEAMIISFAARGSAGPLPASSPSGAVFLAGHRWSERKARSGPDPALGKPRRGGPIRRSGTGATRRRRLAASMARTHPFAETAARPKPHALRGGDAGMVPNDPGSAGRMAWPWSP